MSVLKEFIRKHMKTENVILCNELNEHMWANGGKNPPGKVSVVVVKTKDEKAIVNLSDVGVDEQMKLYAPAAAPKTEKKAEAKDAEVKEVETKEETSKTEAKEKSEKKSTAKKEVKKNE